MHADADNYVLLLTLIEIRNESVPLILHVHADDYVIVLDVLTEKVGTENMVKFQTSTVLHVRADSALLRRIKTLNADSSGQQIGNINSLDLIPAPESRRGKMTCKATS